MNYTENDAPTTWRVSVLVLAFFGAVAFAFLVAGCSIVIRPIGAKSPEVEIVRILAKPAPTPECRQFVVVNNVEFESPCVTPTPIPSPTPKAVVK